MVQIGTQFLDKKSGRRLVARLAQDTASDECSGCFFNGNPESDCPMGFDGCFLCESESDSGTTDYIFVLADATTKTEGFLILCQKTGEPLAFCDGQRSVIHYCEERRLRTLDETPLDSKIVLPEKAESRTVNLEDSWENPVTLTIKRLEGILDVD